MLWYSYRWKPGMAVLWEALPAAAWDRSRYLHVTIGLKSWIAIVKLGEGLKKLKRRQSQPIQTPPGAYTGQSEAPGTYITGLPGQASVEESWKDLRPQGIGRLGEGEALPSRQGGRGTGWETVGEGQKGGNDWNGNKHKFLKVSF